MIFTRQETPEETKDRILSLTDQKDYGMCPPAMDSDTALNELCRHFLGEDWYCSGAIHAWQVNTEIVYAIERVYPRKIPRKIKRK